jgi:8-amino-7-oxononanoate synthase
VILEQGHGRFATVGGKKVLLFSTNNYLGLAGHPEVTKAAQRALRVYGAGAGAARGTTGTLRIHQQTERALALFEGREDAVVFPSGYMAMVGALEGLVGPGGVVVCDELDHPSVSAGCKVARAELHRYRHCDPDSLGETLRGLRGKGDVLVVTSSVFALDGDLAPLQQIACVVEHHGARLLVDEAHGTGVLGALGRGGAEACGAEEGVWAVLGTLSKALGSCGGFLAGPRNAMQQVRSRSSAYKYTTAPAPAACGAARASLRLVRTEPWLRRTLWANKKLLAQGMAELGIDVSRVAAPIFPLVFETVSEARLIAARLFRRGHLVAVIAPPLIPGPTARVRMTVTALHRKQDLEKFLEAVGAVHYVTKE